MAITRGCQSRSVAVSIAEVVHLVIHTHETSPTLPASVVRWNSVVFIAKVCANLMVTVLIVVRMWYLSPRKRRDFLGANLSTGTGWAAIVIVIESGVLYLVAQIIPLILYAIRHPALGLVSSMSVQIYVRTTRHLNSLWTEYPQSHRASHRY
jgi:hypothetical protein